jgi:hypothetical protein
MSTGRRSNVVLWHVGAEPITVEHVDWPPRWSADGRMLALGAAILDADGRRVATLPDPWASSLGWGTYGLYYAAVLANPPGATELWLWDGRATHLLHTLSNDDARLHMGVVAGERSRWSPASKPVCYWREASCAPRTRSRGRWQM